MVTENCFYVLYYVYYERPVVDFCNNKGRLINAGQSIYVTQEKYCDLTPPFPPSPSHMLSPSLDAIVIMHSSPPSYLSRVNSLASKLKFNVQYVRIHS